MNVPCPTHSGRRAHKSCHFCRKPICRLCEVRMRGQLYCSTRCARDAGRHALWRRVHGELVRPVPGRLAVALVAMAASAPVILAMRTVRELDALHAASPLAIPRRSPAPRLESAVELPGGNRLEGTAPEGTAVFLFADGRFVATVAGRDGRFRFDGIRDPGPYRVGALPLSPETAAPAGAPEAAMARPAPAPAPAPALVPASRAPARVAAVATRLPAFEPSPAPAPPPVLAPAARIRVPRGLAAPDITRGPADRPEVLVSFDAGSSDRGAREILSALSRRGIRTTIFVTGDFVRKYPDTARAIAAGGHEVGNHTDTHPHLTTFAADGRQLTRPGVDRAFLAGELSRTARLYREATGRELAPLWRAPFGEHNAQIRRWAAEQGYWHIGWTGGRSGLDGLDWVSDPRSRSYQPAERLLARLVRRAENGGIVLLHLGSDREEPVGGRIDILLDGLAGRGFRFARASDFLERAGYDASRLAAFRAPSDGAAAR